MDMLVTKAGISSVHRLSEQMTKMMQNYMYTPKWMFKDSVVSLMPFHHKINKTGQWPVNLCPFGGMRWFLFVYNNTQDLIIQSDKWFHGKIGNILQVVGFQNNLVTEIK